MDGKNLSQKMFTASQTKTTHEANLKREDLYKRRRNFLIKKPKN